MTPRQLLVSLALVVAASTPAATMQLRQLGIHLGIASADSTAPAARITAPSEGSNMGAGTHDNGSTEPLTTLAGTCSDNVAVASVTWDNDLGSNGTASGTTSWSVASISLLTGTNTITVTCFDTTGNSHTDTLAVDYAPTVSGGVCGVDVTCDFDTSFTSGQGWSMDYTQFGTGCGPGFAGVQTGIGNGGANDTDDNSCDGVLLAANFSGGAGGRGFRHWRGDGSNNNNGGGMNLSITAMPGLSGGATELWVRFYMRHESGMGFVGGGNPNYIKEHYLNVSGTFIIYGHQGGAWGMHSKVGSTNYPGSISWTDLYGGATSDGSWHCHEYYIDRAGTGASTIRVWLDGSLVLEETSIDLDSAALTGIVVGSNQYELAAGADKATDYDDIAFSTTEQIGCF